MSKKIEFKNLKLESQYKEYSNKEESFISGCDSVFAKKIGFLTDAILNDGAGTILDSDVSENIFEEIEEIDVVWTNTRKIGIPNIVFLKWLNINPRNTGTLLDIIQPTIKSTISYWNDFKNENDIIKNTENDHVIALIENIIHDGFSNEVKNINEVEKCYIYFVVQNNGEITTKKEKKTILDSIKSSTNNLIKDSSFTPKNIDINLIFEDDVVGFIKEREGSKICINSDTLLIDKNDNYLEYKNNNVMINDSIVCNVSAKSINRLWSTYSNNLLGLNLRFHVKDKKIDDKMVNSMLPENNDNFWFKNNGLVIICEKFKITNKSLELTNFSIVNGGQTTYNIGQIKDDQFLNNDFFVTTKIISVQGMNEKPTEEVYELTNIIAEATNQQKAIKNQDLIANFSGIKEVKRIFQQDAPVKVFVESRRGESIAIEDKKKLYSAKYQSIKAEQLLQIHNAFYNVVPGSCRSSKAKLYDDKNKINTAFNFIKNNFIIYNELIVIFSIHSKMKSKTNLKKVFENNTNSENFMKFGQYFFLSSIQLLFIMANDKSKARLLFDKESEWRDEKSAKYQENIVAWIQKEFNKLNVQKLFACELNKNNIDDIVESGYINLVKDRFSYIYSKAWRTYNYNGDKIISNFGKTNKEFYLFFVNEFCENIENKGFSDFQELFNIGKDK